MNFILRIIKKWVLKFKLRNKDILHVNFQKTISFIEKKMKMFFVRPRLILKNGYKIQNLYCKK